MPVDLVRDLIARWPDPDAKDVPLLRQAGISAVLLEKPDRPFADACRAAGLQTLLAEELQWATAGSVDAPPGSKPLVLSEGLWPGIARDPAVAGRDVEVASASRDPWIEINAHWIAYLRALHPTRPALLGYKPDLGSRAVPFDSLELALIEARSFGGNYLLAVEPVYRQGLTGGDAKALAAWSQLGRTARWLREHDSLFGQAILPVVTQLVEPGDETPEFAKLMYRRNVSPALESAARLGPPDPRRLLLAAVALKAPGDGLRKRLLAHTESGTSVVVDGPGWPTAGLRLLRKDEDRDIFEAGKGRLIAYRESIADPSEFALDAIDLVTHNRRAVRVWNAPSVVALATGRGVLQCINYGSPIKVEIQVRMQGAFTGATLLRPEAAPAELKVARRGTTSEVFLPELRRLAVVVFR